MWIWKNALTATVDLPDCRDYGYEGDDSTVQPTMMSQRASPPELLSYLVCFVQISALRIVCVCKMSNHVLLHVHAMAAQIQKSVVKTYLPF